MKINLLNKLTYLPLVLLLGLFGVTGILGVDFGHQWDEPIFLTSLKISLETGVFLPHSYIYPSVSYDLSLLGIVPDIIGYYLVNPEPTVGGLNKYLVDSANSHDFLLRLRVLFLLVSSLTIIWTYLTVISWRKNSLEALLAAALVGLSWEVAYHSRWIAPNVIMAQFGMMTIMLLFFAAKAQNNQNKRFWLRLAAVAAALACATKYQAGLFLLPVWMGTLFFTRTFKIKFIVIVETFFIFGLAYYIVSPGTFLEAYQSIQHLKLVALIYNEAGHAGYTTHSGLEHLHLMANYFALVIFSKYSLISLFFFMMSIVGTIYLIKERKIISWVALGFPILYILYLSLQIKVMIVRNLVVLIPFFAIFAARGVFVLQNRFFNKNSLFRAGFATFIITLLLINTFWLIQSTASIVNRHKTNYIQQLAEFIEGNQDKRFLVSTQVLNDLSSLHGKIPSLVTNVPEQAEIAVFYSSEVSNWNAWTANQFNYTLTWFGPDEVNFNYYPSWAGDRRIVVMSVDKLQNLASLIKWQ
ncbi:hypothetical protein THII_1017 [Thioploca ingrica]|uniref:ArnT-like N-terminal domain-containing protein n=1 Tax=Thioploca ingrica TaxID=40754 RepID=A0A090AEH4_9GAMM|nr:hypothetical protein THII_1017 [Thioploca ingrica]